MNERILIGAVTAILCAAGFRSARWFLAETGKGRNLVRWLGPGRALWLVRGLFGIGVAFGILLAIGVIRAIQW